MPQIVHPGMHSIARLLQPSRATDIAEALVGAADWPTALVNEEGWDLGFLEKRIPARLIADQGFYRRGMKRDDANLLSRIVMSPSARFTSLFASRTASPLRIPVVASNPTRW